MMQEIKQLQYTLTNTFGYLVWKWGFIKICWYTKAIF